MQDKLFTRYVPIFLSVTLIVTGTLFWYVQKAQAACGSGYGFCRTITIDHTKNPGTQTNFTVLFSTTTLSSLAVVGSGGNVNNTVSFNGQTVAADLVFSTTSDCGTLMSWDFEHYVTTTGEMQAWILITSLSSSVDTTFYLCYGKASVSTYQGGSVGAAWDSNYKAIWHLPDGSTLAAKDATSNAQNGSFTNTPTATTGQIDGGAALVSASNQSIFNTLPSVPTGVDPRTMEIWFKMSANQAQAIGGYGDNLGAGRRFDFYYNGDPHLYVEIASYGATISWTYDTNWHHLVGVFPSGGTTDSDILMYLDGVSQTVTGDAHALASANSEIRLGAVPGESTAAPFSGSEDEFRISDNVRTANWITTEYNNQSSPGTFYTVGAEQSGGGVATATYTHVSIPNGITSINGKVVIPGN